ncbi:hypothetical protein MHJ95_04070 [Corynebacterium imitans]|uniref:hypothetical protein n=1 Tax=Corynebacterium imitans TaxID=156978 RepID=UPI001EF2BE62|nr:MULTISPECIES: hypothetical protein [Bacteria]MCG7278170.1 hypothetical protein [Corynebacterium imitans]MDK8314215.1 hypothetical protein [Klebsiella aerogenes]MDK8638566.1 hypothetical protein [Corynebacterium imitans]MDK8773773.1 hypothetical protein [Corynebacterium imitans]
MTIDNKVGYRVLAIGTTLLGVVGAILLALGFWQGGLSLIGFGISILPALGHFRMRETLRALKGRTGGSTAFDAQPVLDQIASIDRRLTALADRPSEHPMEDELTSLGDDIKASADQIRRESRLARIAAAQITGKIS